MSHPLLKTAIRLFSTSVLIIVAAKIASACYCAASHPVLDTYNAADTVLIVRLLSVEKVEARKPNNSALAQNSRAATVSVSRVYKGNVKVNQQIILGHTSESNCGWIFDNKEINDEFLLYARAPKTDSPFWLLPNCGRSKAVADATEDLLYLDNIEKRQGKTRVSGRYGDGSKQGPAVAHRRIRIVGDKRSYEVFTDEKGIYELYDLPPGQYSLEPEMPHGWRLNRWFTKLNSSPVTTLSSTKTARFNVEAQKHVSINLAFEPDNIVAGRIVGPNGHALAKICVYLRRPVDDLDTLRGNTRTGCADENGHFRIESIPAGDYVLVLNQDGLAKGAAPFPRVFYLGTTEFAKAITITVEPGQTLQDVDVVVPDMLETVTVEGIALFSDGQPVAKQNVHFEGTNKPGIAGWASAETDEQGRFSLKLLKGQQGKVLSKMGVYPGMYQDCPAVDALFKEPPQKLAIVSTQVIEIKADQNISNLVLGLPIPSCRLKAETAKP